MMNNVKETDIKDRTYYFLDGVIDTKSLDLNRIKSQKNIFIYYIGYIATKFIKAFQLNINKITDTLKESNGNKYLRQVHTDESKGIL